MSAQNKPPKKNGKPTKDKKNNGARKFTLKRLIIAVVSLIALTAASVQLYYLFHFRLYKGHTRYISSYTTEQAIPLSFLPGDDVPGMRCVAESAYLKLYTDTKTADVAVYDKRNGQITYSNPADADNDPNATALNKSFLKSQIIVDHYSAKRTLGTYNSYDQAVSLGQLEYEGLNNGIRYTYTMGDFSSATGIVPVYISEARLNEILSRLDEKDANYIRGRYRQWTEREGYLVLNDAARGWTQIRNMTEYYEKAGYTEDDYLADMLDSGADDAIPLSFTVPLEYRLIDDYLKVSIPASLIKEGGGGMISRIQLLRYFAAGDMTEQGYMLLPNGAGSIVYFNNGKESAANYSQFVYGIDPLIAEYIVTEETQKARLPVFGIGRAESSVLASIEESASLSSVTAYVSGAMNSYNFVYPTFILRNGERLTMFGSTDISAELPIVENEFYDLNYSVKYYFLTGEFGDNYSGMANFYRQKLINEGKLVKKAQIGADIPFYMDLLGGAQGSDFFLGVQYYNTIPMTTFARAEDISNELYDKGITNQVVNYTGWFNRGYYHDVPNKVKVIGKLGGRNGLSSFTDNVTAKGGRVYGDVAFQNVTFASRRFNWQLESSRYYGAGFVANFGMVHPVANMQTYHLGYTECLYDCLSPRYLDRYITKFKEEIEGINITGIGLRDLGDVLHSDKRRTELIDRHRAESIVTAMFDSLNETGKDIMVTGGNLYSLRYADDVIGVPLSHNAFFIIDEEVPFYQMILHGYVDYAGDPINLITTWDANDVALALIEMGASPRYAFTYESASLLKETGLNRYRSVTFDNWKEEAAYVYSLVNSTLKEVAGYPIIKHEILQNGVTATTYENGITIIVNKNEYPVIAKSVEIQARTWRVFR